MKLRVFRSSRREKRVGYIPIQPRFVGAPHYLFGAKEGSARDRFFEGLGSTGVGTRTPDLRIMRPPL